MYCFLLKFRILATPRKFFGLSGLHNYRHYVKSWSKSEGCTTWGCADTQDFNIRLTSIWTACNVTAWFPLFFCDFI